MLVISVASGDATRLSDPELVGSNPGNLVAVRFPASVPELSDSDTRPGPCPCTCGSSAGVTKAVTPNPWLS